MITGAYGGIAREVCLDLARHGAQLSLIGRRPDRLGDLLSELSPGGHITCTLDVRAFEAWSDNIDRICPEGELHGLVTAAGELGPIGPAGSWDPHRFERTFATNVMGLVCPIAAFLEHLTDARGSVVAFSGGGGTSPLRRFDAYATSKAAVVRLVENMSADLADRGVRVNAVAPGFIVTDIHEATMAAGPEAVGAAYFERTRRGVEGGEADSVQDAVALTRFLLSAESVGITGRLISAPWDPWRDPVFRQRLREDVALARLRRIDDQFFSALEPR